jgi:hypothetical protein
MSGKIFPLKKYKGEPMEVVLQDREYCDWLVKQPWFRDKFASYYQIIINNFGEPKSTPEHNELQARFLKDNFCLALGLLCKWQLMNKKQCIMNFGRAIRINKELLYKNDNQNQYSKYYELLEEINDMRNLMEENIIEIDGQELMEGEPFFRVQREFEQDGWDVIIKTDDGFCRSECAIWKDCSIKTKQLAIEIKPSLGDDFPDILRQIKSARTHPDHQCLVYENFNTESVTIDEVKKMFLSSGILIFSVAEIENEEKLLIAEKGNP